MTEKQTERKIASLERRVAQLELHLQKIRSANGRHTIPKKPARSRELTADPLESFIGMCDSRLPDWAERHDAYLGDNLAKELQVQGQLTHG